MLSLNMTDKHAGWRRVQVLITLDGYSAPISAGNFVVNVLDGLYNNK